MNAERLIKHFDRIAEAPGAVPRLRKFVLDLAVRGKLTSRCADDDLAASLLDRALNEVPPPFELPAGWCWTNIAGICSKTGSGSTPRGGKTVYREDGIPFLRSQNVYNDGLRLDEVAYIDRATHDRMAGTKVMPNDLLLNITGGSIGRCCLIPNDFGDANVSQHVAILRVAVPDVAKFLHLFVLAPYFQRFIFDEQTGAGRGGLPKKRMDRIVVALPPLAEQRRIVAKVEELMALCDRLGSAQAAREQHRTRWVGSMAYRLVRRSPAEGSTTREIADLDRIPMLASRAEDIGVVRQAVLDLAVEGRLCPQSPHDDPGRSLLDRLRKERQRCAPRRKGTNPAESSQVEDELSSIPSTWAWVTIGDLLDGDSQNGYSRKPDEAPDGIPILRINAATTRADGIVAEEQHKLIGRVPLAMREQLMLEGGDLLACRFNGNRKFVGRLALYEGYLNLRMIYPDKLIRLRLLRDFALPQLLRYFGESRFVRSEIESYAATTVGNWGISAGNLKKVRVPLPPLAEQRRIVAKVDQLMALCDRLEAQLALSERESRRLLEAVLREVLADDDATRSGPSSSTGSGGVATQGR